MYGATSTVSRDIWRHLGFRYKIISFVVIIVNSTILLITMMAIYFAVLFVIASHTEKKSILVLFWFLALITLWLYAIGIFNG